MSISQSRILITVALVSIGLMFLLPLIMWIAANGPAIENERIERKMRNGATFCESHPEVESCRS